MTYLSQVIDFHYMTIAAGDIPIGANLFLGKVLTVHIKGKYLKIGVQ